MRSIWSCFFQTLVSFSHVIGILVIGSGSSSFICLFVKMVGFYGLSECVLFHEIFGVRNNRGFRGMETDPSDD